MIFNEELIFGFVMFIVTILSTIAMFSIHESFLILAFPSAVIGGVMLWISQLEPILTKETKSCGDLK